MSPPLDELRVLDGSAAARELDLASELFHRINRVIPQEQQVLSVAPGISAREAVALLRAHGYSQAPVVENGRVLGVFSYRSFAKEAASGNLEQWSRQRCAPGDLPVDEFLERFEFTRITEEMTHVFDSMERDNGVLVGTPERLTGILTPMDFLRYLYQVASPFVMLSEIELALRALIRLSMPAEQLASAAVRCLSSAYGGPDSVPTTLEEMTFDNYQSLIANDDNWTTLGATLGGARLRTSAKLKEIAGIRNAVFHFRRAITREDARVLAGCRDWLLNKIHQADGQRTTEARSEHS